MITDDREDKVLGFDDLGSQHRPIVDVGEVVAAVAVTDSQLLHDFVLAQESFHERFEIFAVNGHAGMALMHHKSCRHSNGTEHLMGAELKNNLLGKTSLQIARQTRGRPA
jgi:hypothetical protein